MAVQPEYSQLLESAMTPQCEINSELLNTHNDSKQQAIYYALYPSVAIDALACPLCFHVPNRAKLLPCCQYMICGPCARLWLHPSHSPRSLSYDPRTQPLQPSPPPPSCPFCRAVVSTEMALSGLPDATATQQKCIIGVDPETGTPGSSPFLHHRVAFPAHRLSHHSSHDDIDHSSDDLLRGSTDRDATGGVMQVLPSLAGDSSYNGTGMTINMSAREQTHPVLDTVPWVPRGMQRCWKSIFVGVLALGIFILALMVRRDISAY
ncbi:hypothetical protein BASA83_000192 [Batrachochytrium salamandrivorans]|nr:hypothetical protein BASA83_000192 [Batrachochytrium salamandrivorans]